MDSEALTIIESLKRGHYICEDCWYSCPASGECCRHEESACNCGATKHNEKLDKLTQMLQEHP